MPAWQRRLALNAILLMIYWVKLNVYMINGGFRFVAPPYANIGDNNAKRIKRLVCTLVINSQGI